MGSHVRQNIAGGVDAERDPNSIYLSSQSRQKLRRQYFCAHSLDHVYRWYKL